MPRLPSGKDLTIELLLVGSHFFPEIDIPQGYFFPILTDDFDKFFFSFKDVPESNVFRPLPKSIEEVKQYICVRIQNMIGNSLIKKTISLANFKPEEWLEEEDAKIFTEWVNDEPTRLYLEMCIDDCYEQAGKFNIHDQPGEQTAEEIATRNQKIGDVSEGETLLDSPDTIRARDYLNILLNMNLSFPPSECTWTNMVLRFLGELQRWDEGETIFLEKISLKPDKICYRIGFLKCLYFQKKYERVIEKVHEDLAFHPDEIDYWLLLIGSNIESGQYNDALQIIKNGLASNPGNQDILNMKERIITKIEESKQQKR